MKGSNMRCHTMAAGLALSACVTVVQAKELPVDYTHCFAGTNSALVDTKEMRVFAAEHRGITRSNIADKALDSHTMHCTGLATVLDGVVTAQGSCKFQSPDGDWYVGEYVRQKGATAPGGTWTVTFGTGRWKGMTGSASYKPNTPNAKAITPGTAQGCLDVKGSYRLPD